MTDEPVPTTQHELDLWNAGVRSVISGIGKILEAMAQQPSCLKRDRAIEHFRIISDAAAGFLMTFDPPEAA